MLQRYTKECTVVPCIHFVYTSWAKLGNMLKKLFTSNTRIKLLSTFLMHPDDEFFIRELTRKLKEQINSVRRELDNLKKLGLLKAKNRNRKKYYHLNKDFILHDELRSIILKSLTSGEGIAKEIEKMGEVKILILSGVFAGQETESVDLLIVGEVNKDQLADYLNELKTPRPVKFATISEEDYQYRLNCKDRFITDLLRDQNSSIPIKKI